MVGCVYVCVTQIGHITNPSIALWKYIFLILGAISVLCTFSTLVKQDGVGMFLLTDVWLYGSLIRALVLLPGFSR